ILQQTFDQLLATASGPKEFRFGDAPQRPPSTTALARRQLDNATLSQLGQQQPGRHVFELSARSAPVECFAYRARESAAAPEGMLGNQAPDDFHILRPQPTPLHHLGNKHSQFLAHSISGSQKKVRAPYLRQTALNRYMSSGGKEALNNPKLWSRWSHWQSLTSVLRPGTWRTCRALTRNTSMPAASSFWQRAIQ